MRHVSTCSRSEDVHVPICCKQDIPLQIEHIHPKANGGTNRIGNLCLACEKCNLAKGTKNIIECLDIGDTNITHPATLLWWFLRWIGDIELQSDPITFDNGKPLVVVGGR